MWWQGSMATQTEVGLHMARARTALAQSSDNLDLD
jgi:hypothetical protein